MQQERQHATGDPAAAAGRAENRALVELASNATADIAAHNAHQPHPTRKLALLLACAGLGLAAGHMFTTSRAATASQLPATPRQWVDAYEAAAIDNPSQVCTQLFAAQLAALYAKAAHQSCPRYFSRVKSTSLQIRGVLQQGQTAVVRLHQTIQNTAWAVVLQRHAASWWAIDLIPGHPLR